MSTEIRQILDMNAFDPASAGTNASPLLKRRTRNFGAASVLFYKKPLEIVSAKGCWMTDKDDVSYLDFYNNVPSVGHSHPAVANAVFEQLKILNVNSRYLYETTESYIEKLKTTLPDHLGNVVMACSGSEANDLALRIAMTNSGAKGVIVTATAYHGNTSLITDISPSAFKKGHSPDWVAIVPEPSRASYGDDIPGGFASAVADAIKKLEKSGHGCAALICDSIFSSDGVFSDPKGFLKPAVDAIQAAGGFYIADEVQPGFCRTGECFWGFQRHDVKPDIVTMGKPMGNGYPVAALAVRPDLLDAFCSNVGYFNTFGATPGAAAAATAVLEIIEKESLQKNALETGAYLKQQIQLLAEHDHHIGEVRGVGLFIGVDICEGSPDKPAPALATAIMNGLREEHVLIGGAGPYGHTLKVRPPLCLNKEEVDFFIKGLSSVLATLKTS